MALACKEAEMFKFVNARLCNNTLIQILIGGNAVQLPRFNHYAPKDVFFLYLSFLRYAFIQLVFQALNSVQTGFLIGAWQPSGLNY